MTPLTEVTCIVYIYLSIPPSCRCTLLPTASMAEQQENRSQHKVGFKNIQLLKNQTLGVGSYGAVCQAKCDDLHCAAKLLHPTLFDPTAQHQIATRREHRLPIRRFELECEFMSAIRHPNIVQYLGMYQDPDTRLPVLLMELMDDSLTHFLESSPQPIPYHIQVNICHDITLALSFLHSNEIIHRDLSGNNVLLISNTRAKVTDFGMARLGELNPQATHLDELTSTKLIIPLLLIALDCLSDQDTKRPSAQQLCERVVLRLTNGPLLLICQHLICIPQ